MPSNWKIFWLYPALYGIQLLVRIWHGRILSTETEFYAFSIGWIIVFLISILMDRAFSRVSTAEIDREKDLVRRFIRGKEDGVRISGNPRDDARGSHRAVESSLEVLTGEDPECPRRPAR